MDILQNLNIGEGTLNVIYALGGFWLVFLNGSTLIVKYVVKANVLFNTKIVDKVLGIIPPLHGWIQSKQVKELEATKVSIDNGIKSIKLN